VTRALKERLRAVSAGEEPGFANWLAYAGEGA
jgi:hypothetical protein